jgi:hypothetical protein
MKYILFVLITVLIFSTILFYKLMDRNWRRQFMSGNFTDKDLFTKLVKFLMK